MQRRRLFLMSAALFGLSAIFSAAAQDYDRDEFRYEREFHLGRVWQVREFVPDGGVWEGTWVRRGHSRIFDASWRNNMTGRTGNDVIEFRGLEDRTVTLYRIGISGYYRGHVSHDGRHIRRGTATWYRPGTYWEAEILD